MSRANPHGHRWDICGHCGPMVRCGKCNNNTCNGGRGQVNGEWCDACEDAWKLKQAGPPDEFKQSPEFIAWSKEEAWRLHEESQKRP